MAALAPPALLAILVAIVADKLVITVLILVTAAVRLLILVAIAAETEANAALVAIESPTIALIEVIAAVFTDTNADTAATFEAVGTAVPPTNTFVDA